MKALIISDQEAKKFYDYYMPGSLDEYDIIISCGDLHKSYLEFLATMTSCPIIYVRGNHDDDLNSNPPGGCICIEDTVYEYQGVRFLGLGGSAKYKENAKNQYTEQEMRKRIRKLRLRRKLKNGFDVLVTHAPIYGVGDMDTVAHRGFECFVELVEEFHPKYVLHGHVHLNYTRNERIQKYKNTKVINAFEYCVEEIRA